MKGLCGYPNCGSSCRGLLKSPGVSIQKISKVNNEREGNFNVSNLLFFPVNSFFSFFFPPPTPPPLFLPFLAVEDNVTEDQHSPGQTAIPSGNAPLHISSFSAGEWHLCVCVCTCVYNLFVFGMTCGEKLPSFSAVFNLLILYGYMCLSATLCLSSRSEQSCLHVSVHPYLSSTPIPPATPNPKPASLCLLSRLCDVE